MTQSEWNKYALSQGQIAQEQNADKIAQEVADTNRRNMMAQEANRDADSAKYWRLQGGDSTEVFHDETPKYNLNTGEGLDASRDSKNSRKKVYDQYQYMHGGSIEDAILAVDRQSEAYKISKDAGYDLGKQVSNARAQGNIDSGFTPTSFDIYNQGEEQLAWAEQDKIENPNTAFDESYKFLTGEKGAFGREMADNTEYVDRAIAAGVMTPGSNDPKRLHLQNAAREKARKLGIGSFKTDTDKRIMDAIDATSYTTNYDGKYHDTSILGRAANAGKAAVSTVIGAGYGVLDAGSELLGAATGGVIGGDIATSSEIDKFANEATGYDPYFAEHSQKKIKSAYRKYQADDDFGGFLVDAGIEGLKAAPEMAAQSLAFVASLFMPGKALQGVTKVGRLIKAETAGMNAVDKAAKTKLLMKDAEALSKMDKLVHGITGQAGFIGISASDTSSDMDTYKEDTGNDMTVPRVLGSMGINMIKNNLDGFIDKNIITANGIGSKQVLDLISKASDGSKIALAKELTARGFGVASDTILKEIPTEIIQSEMEAVSQQYGGDKSLKEILTDQEAQENMAVSAMSTPGSVVAMKGAGAVLEGTGQIAGKAVDKVQEIRENRAAEEVEDTIEPEVPAQPIFNDIDSTEDVNEAKAKVFDYVKKYKAGELTTDEFKQVDSANKALKERVAVQQVERGESLGATPEEESAAINAYFMMEDDAEAEAYRASASKTNPELVEKFTEAAEARKVYKELGEGLGLTRKQVVSEGVDADKAGFHTYFRDAIRAETDEERADAKLKLGKFADNQQKKVEKLDAIKRGAEAVIHDKIKKIAEDSELDTTTVVKAMMQAEGSLLAYNKEQNKEYFSDLIAVLKGLGLPTDTQEALAKSTDKLKTKGFLVGEYASEQYSKAGDRRKAGTFEANYYESLPDIAEEYGVTNVLLKENRVGGSPINTTSQAINRELVAMRKALSLIEKREGRGNEIQEDTVDVVPEETVPDDVEVTSTKPNAVAPDEESSYQEVVKGDTVSPKVETKPKAIAPDEQSAEQQSGRRSDNVATKTEAKVQEPEKPKKKRTFVDKHIDMDVDNATVDELTQAQNEMNKVKNIPADVADAFKVTKDAIDKRLPELRAKNKEDAAEKRQKAEAKVAELTELRDAAVSKIADIKESVADITKVTAEVNAKIADRIAVRKELVKVTKEIQEKADTLDQWTGQMNEKIQDEVPGVDALNPAEIDKTLTLVEKAIVVLKDVNKELVVIAQAFVDSVKELIDIINGKKAMKKLLEAEEKALSNEIIDMSAVVAYELDDNHWQSRRKAAKAAKLETISELKGINKELAGAKEELKGTAYTAEIIANSKKGKETTSKPSTAEEKVPLDMSSVLTTTKPSTQLGDRRLGRDEMTELGFNNSQLAKRLKGLNLDSGDTLGRYTYLMTMLDNNNVIDNNVRAAMILSVDNYIGENLGSLEQVTGKDIESFYGFTDINAVENVGIYLEGGIPRAQVAKRVAGDIMKSLGLTYKGKKDNDGNIVDTQEELFEKISIGLANAAIQDAIDVGKIKVKDIYRPGSSDPTPTIKLADEHNMDASTRLAHKNALVSRLAKYEEKLGLEKAERTIKTESGTRTVDDVKIRGNEYTEAAPMAKQAVVKEESDKWNPNVELIQGLVELGEDPLKTLLGYKAEDKTAPLEAQLSLLGKNRQISDDVENMMILWRAIEDGTVTDEMYFDWFVSKNGRIMMDARGGFNPQSIKLHRYATYKDDMKGTVDPKDEQSVQMYKLGIAQALGFSIDKKAVEDSTAFADALLNEKGSFDMILSEMKKGNTEFEVAGVKIEIEEPSHAMQAVVEGKKYTKDKPFETVMTLEVDGLTNGFAHKMLQYLTTDGKADATDLSPSAVKWLNKVGIQFTDGETVGDISARLDQNSADAIVDAYWTLGGELTSGKGDLADKLLVRLAEDKDAAGTMDKHFDVDNTKAAKYKADKLLAVTEDLTEVDGNGETVLVKAVRDLMKGPFMTWGYQAGFKSISNTIASSLLDNVVKQVSEYDGTNKAIKEYVEMLNIGTIEEVQKQLPTTLYSSIGVNSENGSFEAQFRKHVAGVYGDAVKDVMNKEFGAVTEINKSVTDTTKMMFELFNPLLEEYTKDGAVMPSELTKLVKDELWDVFPLVEGPLSKDKDQKDFIPAVTETLATARGNKHGPIQTYLGKDIKDSYINTTRKTLGDPGVGLGVGMTHNEDAAGTIMNMLNHQLLQIFDAYVLGVGQSQAVNDANKDFAEMNMREDWSQIKAVEQGLERMLSNLETRLGKDKFKEHMDTVHKNMQDEAVERSKNYKGFDEAKVRAKVPTPVQQLANIAEIRVANDSRREALKGNSLDVQQFVHDAKTGYTHEGATKKAPKADVKKPTMRSKIEALLEAYNSELAPTVGGGYVENVQGAAVTDEDVAAGTFERGTQDTSVKDILPILDGRTLSAMTKAVSRYYNESDRRPGTRKYVEQAIALVQEVESEPAIANEVFVTTKQAYANSNPADTKPEDSIIADKEELMNILNSITAKDGKPTVGIQKVLDMMENC